MSIYEILAWLVNVATVTCVVATALLLMSLLTRDE